MHDLITTFTLGLVEGITEFLPVSSTGHLIIFNQWFSFSPEFSKVFDIFIQSGAIFAVVVFYFKEIFDIAIWKKLLVAFVPAAVIGFLIGNAIEEKLFNSFVVAVALIIGGIILILVEKYFDKNNDSLNFNSVEGDGHICEKIFYWQALVIGCFQCLAFIPGTSRAAATIIGGIASGLSRKTAAKFSFLLAIPTLVAASGYSLLKHIDSVDMNGTIYLFIGFAISFVTAYLVVKWFMNYLSKHKLNLFGWYRIALGIAVLIFISLV